MSVAIVGAGVGGLVAALALSARGVAVTVLERAATPGGKMRVATVADARIDAGPTVFTLRRIFDEIFAEADASLDDHLALEPLDLLARHAWADGARLDLFADPARSAEAIGAFAGRAEAARFRTFCRDAQRTFETLDGAFMRKPAPSLFGLIGGAGFGGLGDLRAIRPFSTLWQALGDYFHDPRLRQLFGRYATYCGSSPFLSPATLMLVAHVEQDGVWSIRGGMHRLAGTLARLAAERGATFRYGAEVAETVVRNGRACGVVLATGERIDADAVLVNADVAAVAAGLFGRDAAKALPRTTAAARSLSAMTWALTAETDGFPLARHNVFFSEDYAAEFDDIFRDARVPRAPTVYVCAQDRQDGEAGASGAERLLCLINAPANGDTHTPDAAEIASCERRTFDLLAQCGLTLRHSPDAMAVTTPADFARLFPATGGALYGQASHGWTASFQRPGVRTRIPGLYLAGGSTHPGPGVPMAALSGRMAAAAMLEDLASTGRSRATATSGGTSTRSATTDSTR